MAQPAHRTTPQPPLQPARAGLAARRAALCAAAALAAGCAAPQAHVATRPATQPADAVRVSGELDRSDWPRFATGPAAGGRAPYGPRYFYNDPVPSPVPRVARTEVSPERGVVAALASGRAEAYRDGDLAAVGRQPWLLARDWALLPARLLVLEPPWDFPARPRR